MTGFYALGQLLISVCDLQMDRDIDAALNKARAAEQQEDAELQRLLIESQPVYYTTGTSAATVDLGPPAARQTLSCSVQ